MLLGVCWVCQGTHDSPIIFSEVTVYVKDQNYSNHSSQMIKLAFNTSPLWFDPVLGYSSFKQGWCHCVLRHRKYAQEIKSHVANTCTRHTWTILVLLLGLCANYCCFCLVELFLQQPNQSFHVYPTLHRVLPLYLDGIWTSQVWYKRSHMGLWRKNALW